MPPSRIKKENMGRPRLSRGGGLPGEEGFPEERVPGPQLQDFPGSLTGDSRHSCPPINPVSCGNTPLRCPQEQLVF